MKALHTSCMQLSTQMQENVSTLISTISLRQNGKLNGMHQQLWWATDNGLINCALPSVGSTLHQHLLTIHLETLSPLTFTMKVVQPFLVKGTVTRTMMTDIYGTGLISSSSSRFTAERLESNSNRFNTIFGALEPRISNAVLVYGEHDPWSVIGRRTNLTEDAVAIVIEGMLTRTTCPVPCNKI